MSRFPACVERLALAGVLSVACSLATAAIADSTTNDGSSEATRDSRAMHSAGRSGVHQPVQEQWAPATVPADPTRIDRSWYIGPDGVMPNGLLPNPPTYG